MLPEPTLKPAQCLDALEANLKTVLLYTGSALSEPSNFEPTNVNQTKARLGSRLPPALDEFSRALRNLELELIRAKSALTRDLTSSREARLAATSKATSGNSPQPIDIDADTVMIEAPTKKEDLDAKGQIAGSKQGAPNQVHGTDIDADMEIDLFDHPKPTDDSEPTGNTSAPQGLAKDRQTEQSQQNSNDTNNDTATSGTSAVGNVVSADKDGDQAKPSSTTDGANNNNNNDDDNDDDDLSLLFGVEQFATDENTNDGAGNNEQSQTDKEATKNMDGQDANAGDQTGENQDQSQADNSLDNSNSNGLAEGLDFDFNTFDFGLDADNMGDSNLDGTGQGDTQGWDSTFFDDNFFNLDGLN